MSQRIQVLDVCRGFLLLCMTFNHLLAFPFISAEALHAWDVNIVYGKFGFLSNSEGFFFLAGVTAGIVYGKLLLAGRGVEVGTRVRRRMGQMYGSYLLLFAAVTLALLLSRTYWAHWKTLHTLIFVWIDQPGIHYFLDHPLQGFALGAAFLFNIPFLDLFITYICLLLLTPWLLKQLDRGRIFSLLAVSICCYIASQYDPGLLEGSVKKIIPMAKLSWFHLGAIQVLFVTGLTLGFLYVKGNFPNIHKVFAAALLILGAIFCLLLLTEGEFQNRHNLSIFRLGVFSFKAYGVFLIHRILTFKPLALLGRHALTVFTYHIGLVFFLVYFLSEIGSLPLSAKIGCLILSLATIWIPAAIMEKRREARALLKKAV